MIYMKKEKDQVQALIKLFERLQRFQLRLNLTKCSFKVKTRKLLLGFLVSSQGTEVNPNKVNVI
jgi:hypothetical protein